MSASFLPLRPRALACGVATLALAFAANAQVWESDLGTAQGMIGLGLHDEGTINLPLGFNFPLPGGGTTTSVDACPNGYIWLNGFATAADDSDWDESVPELLSEPARIFALWDDLEFEYGAFAGDLYFNTFPAVGMTPARAVITYFATEYGSATATVTMQVQLLDTGAFSIYFQDAGTDGIVGVSPGGGATDPGPADLSAGVTGGGSTIYEVFTAATPCDLQDHLLLFNPNLTNGYDVSALVVPQTLADVTSRGAGCPYLPVKMLYEYFTTTGNPWDIPPMTSFRYTWTGNGYGVSTVPYTWESSLTNQLVLGDDAFSAPLSLGFNAAVWGGSVSQVLISSNGRVHFDINTMASTLPIRTILALAGFLNNGPVLSIAGYDFDPSAGGAVYFDTFTSPARAVVTFQNVPRYNYPNETGTVQAQIFPSGDLLVSYQGLNFTQDGNIGLFMGDTTPASPTIDYTNDLPTITLLSPIDPRMSSNMPFIGKMFTATVDYLDASTIAAVMLMGQPVAAVPLDVLGMPGCSAYTLAELGQLPMALAGTSATVGLPIPSSPALQGAQLTLEAIAVAPLLTSALKLNASDALDLTIGY